MSWPVDRPDPPETVAELVDRARRLAGHPLASIATRLGVDVPADQTRAKGWVGQILECALGAALGARARAAPDFESLGVELKTIPVDARGQPRQSTYVTRVPLGLMSRLRWEDSLVRRKLARVLWLPVEAEPSIPLGARRVGNPLLWQLDAASEADLRADWDDLAALIAAGYVESLTGHRGRALQVRPKAASARARTWGRDAEGAPMRTLPRGFYLRRRFTAAILERHFALR